jgi:hypothetical protein
MHAFLLQLLLLLLRLSALHLMLLHLHHQQQQQYCCPKHPSRTLSVPKQHAQAAAAVHCTPADPLLLHC